MVEIELRSDAEPRARGADTVALSALGDLILAGEWDALTGTGGLAEALHELAEVCGRDDLVFANLETAVLGSEGTIAKEPVVLACLDTVAAALRLLHVNVVSLANNHTFDAHLSGFEQVQRLLQRERLRHLGAGHDLREASAPLIFESRNIRFGWLAYAAAATRPSHIASDTGRHGVNPLDQAGALAAVEELRRGVDHVIVSIHWGVEYCDRPSPDQVRFARDVVDSGASLVLGHHAHVVQGVESVGGGVIAYNLGNATTTDFSISGRLAIRQTPQTRSSFLLRAVFSPQRLEAIELIPFRDHQGTLGVGDSKARAFLTRATRHLAAGVTPARWRWVRLYEDLVVRTLRKLHPRVVRSIRPRHLAQFFKNLLAALRGTEAS